MKRLIACLVAVILLFTVTMPKTEAKADGLTLGMVGAAAYTIARDSGLLYTFASGGNALTDAKSYIENRINSWLAGRTLAEAFGSEIIRLNVGKLVIPAVLYNNIKSFLTSEISTQKITSTDSVVSVGTFYGYNVYPYAVKNSPSSYTSVLTNSFDSSPSQTGLSVVRGPGACEFKVYLDGVLIGSRTGNENYEQQFGWALCHSSRYGTGLSVVTFYENQYGSLGPHVDINNYASQITGATVNARTDSFDGEDLDVGYEWQGTIDGASDTNVEQLINDVYSAVGANDLVINDESIVETPVPTPAPTTAPGTIDDVIGGLGTISGQLEGIDNTMTGVQEGVGEAVGQLEGINEGVGSISEALEVPTASEAPSFKFDLTTLFPFCIPFDIYRFVTMFSASPVAPHVQIPFNIPAVGLQYTFDLDFSSFNGVASVLRSVELIAFCVGLAILTSKVIRW